MLHDMQGKRLRPAIASKDVFTQSVMYCPDTRLAVLNWATWLGACFTSALTRILEITDCKTPTRPHPPSTAAALLTSAVSLATQQSDLLHAGVLACVEEAYILLYSGRKQPRWLIKRTRPHTT